MFGGQLFLMFHNPVDATDVAEILADEQYKYMQVGYTGIWLPDTQSFACLISELPGLKDDLKIILSGTCA